MAKQVINADLLKERNNATFNVERLVHVLDGGSDVTDRRRALIARALKEEVYTEGPDYNFLARQEQYDRSVKKSAHTKKLCDEWKLDIQQRSWLSNYVAFPNESSADNLHGGMFLPTLENQCTEEQKKRWLPKAYRREYLGTYSQTELGHGTHLRKLETTATYDPKTEEFVIHSPTTSAMKWWPGGQGKTTNCAVVMAQLYSQGVNHGIHPFFVVFRDLHTHQPLPGISVGDIGPKFGFNAIDNGFLKFDQYRIPRENMLMRYSEVLKDGTFIRKTKQKRPSYSTMTMVRTFIVRGAYFGLAEAVIISIRYSAVRRQSELQPNAPEPQILDYQTQQYKLFPYLAMAYAFKFAFDRLFTMFIEAMGEVNSGDDSKMPELHALSSGLKAYTTSLSCQGIEQARMCCGGHGYSAASGFPKIYTHFVPGVTYEGENTVLLLQEARYLLKVVGQINRGEKVAPSVQYLARPSTRCSIDERFTLESLCEAFEHRAKRVIEEAAKIVNQYQAKGLQEYDARNRSGVYLIRAAKAHSEQFVIKNFVEFLESVEDESVRLVLGQLCRLLAAYLMNSQSGDFLLDGYLSPAQCQLVRDQEGALLADLRHNAVALVDAFDIPDHTLGSVLGRYDGQVYDNLYQWALASPLNDTQVHGSYYKYLQPMMKAKI